VSASVMNPCRAVHPSASGGAATSSGPGDAALIAPHLDRCRCDAWDTRMRASVIDYLLSGPLCQVSATTRAVPAAPGHSMRAPYPHSASGWISAARHLWISSKAGHQGGVLPGRRSSTNSRLALTSHPTTVARGLPVTSHRLTLATIPRCPGFPDGRRSAGVPGILSA
jgi:hypothetical protein